MGEWVSDAVGALGGEAVGAVVGGIVIAAIGAAGVTLAAPVAATIMLGGILVGGIVGGNAGQSLWNEFSDLFDHLVPDNYSPDTHNDTGNYQENLPNNQQDHIQSPPPHDQSDTPVSADDGHSNHNDQANTINNSYHGNGNDGSNGDGSGENAGNINVTFTIDDTTGDITVEYSDGIHSSTLYGTPLYGESYDHFWCMTKQ